MLVTGQDGRTLRIGAWCNTCRWAALVGKAKRRTGRGFSSAPHGPAHRARSPTPEATVPAGGRLPIERVGGLLWSCPLEATSSGKTVSGNGRPVKTWRRQGGGRRQLRSQQGAGGGR